MSLKVMLIMRTFMTLRSKFVALQVRVWLDPGRTEDSPVGLLLQTPEPDPKQCLVFNPGRLSFSFLWVNAQFFRLLLTAGIGKTREYPK